MPTVKSQTPLSPAFKPQPVPDPLPQPGGKASSKAAASSQAVFGAPPGRFRQFYQNNKWYFWAIILGIAIIGTLAYFAFRKQAPEPTEEANVTVSIEAVDTAPAGGEVVYKVHIENQDPADLVEISLEMVYDDDMKYISSVPEADNISGSRFPVPDLKSGESTTLMIKTMASGDINTEKVVSAKLHYKFSNFNSEFIAEASHTVRLVAADIVLDVTGPEKASNVQTANYDIYFRNDSDKAINGARIRVTYPDEFKYTGSSPEPSVGENVWNLNTVEPNGSGKIAFNGNFKGSRSGQAAVFKIEFLALDEKGTPFTQSSTTYMTTIESLPLTVEQRLVNENPNSIVEPGSSLQYELKFQNNTDVVATGVQVVMNLSSKAIDSSTIRAESGLVENNTITWNAASERKLERLNPGDSGTVRFSFQLKNPVATDNSKNVEVRTKPRIKSNENQAFIDGNELVLKVTSPASITRAVTSVGGAAPPKVGQETTLQVNLSLRNGTNDYRESVFIGYIPLGVTFDRASLPASETAAVKFDPATGKLTWTVGVLAANSGAAVPLRTLSFNVKVKPTPNQAGQTITLLKNIAFTAKDSFTNQNISLNSQEVNTDSLPGENAGRVQP